MNLSYQLRLLIVLISIGVLAGGGLLLKRVLTPESFGVYGPYRADAIAEAALVPIRHGNNTSCFKCHSYETKVHKNGRHQTISCEFCHGTYADHIANEKKIGTLPVKKGKEITTLCLRCHNTEIKARSEEVIKTVAMPNHLTDQNVKLTHDCNQCHHVHAPLKYIIRAKQITGLMEARL
ncbi:MAG: cytochrome c3 family protein [Proteobacteria bacterium]|nr:cytochrome c3 family protein [Pseudomonadota bacterium]MBU1581456.1 cytochrome c3 family protein [Pseudomonadota bacterium]MBU2627321.1 cytochrome c3 family protein [Pseudomonadota bacterium]